MEFKLSSDAPARSARPTRRRGALEQESGARGAMDGTNRTTPNPRRRAARENGQGLTENAQRAGSLRRPTERVALGVRPRALLWCAPYPLARGLGARERRAGGGATDGTNETTPNPQRRAARERGRGLTENARRANSLRRPTECVALGVRPRARSWLRAGAGPRSERAARARRGDGQDEPNKAKSPTKGGARTRPRTHRERAARGLAASANRARRARRASARPLAARALPAGAGTRSERAARAGRRTARTNDVKPPTKSGARTRPRTHRECAARGLPAPAERVRRARRASARPLVVRALPASVGPRSGRVARAGRGDG